ncbi:MAG: SGNH/GDSL hydrolase family protein, partial [Acidobacteria bacterium]|nr:SGNH/GDSL hydrolase family protein [Acidobacteriota bacterium]
MKLAGLPVNPFFLPVYFAQGNYVRAVTPRLPDAAGPTEGACAGREPALRLLVIGDSTVAGIGAATHEFALTGRLAHHLSLLTQRKVHWRAVGQTHATIPVLRKRLLPRLKNETADLIAFSIGINDTTRLHSPEQWEANLRALLTDLRAQFGAIPIV